MQKCAKCVYTGQGPDKIPSPSFVQAGTTLSLKNLFHSLPVRRKEFIRNIKKVSLHIHARAVHTVYTHARTLYM